MNFRDIIRNINRDYAQSAVLFYTLQCPFLVAQDNCLTVGKRSNRV